jgi:chromosome segregation ATPase
MSDTGATSIQAGIDALNLQDELRRQHAAIERLQKSIDYGISVIADRQAEIERLNGLLETARKVHEIDAGIAASHAEKIERLTRERDALSAQVDRLTATNTILRESRDLSDAAVQSLRAELDAAKSSIGFLKERVLAYQSAWDAQDAHRMIAAIDYREAQCVELRAVREVERLRAELDALKRQEPVAPDFLDEIAGYCRVAFGVDGAAYNDGVDAMLAECKRLLCAQQEPTK